MNHQSPAKLVAFRSQVLPALAGLLLLAAPAQAQLPSTVLETIFPPGGQAGSEVEVTVGGRDLDEAGKLHFSHAGITAEQKMNEPDAFHEKAWPQKNQFVVKIGKDVPPGTYEARVVGRFGISNSRAFVVGTFPEKVVNGEPRTRKEPLPLEIGSTVYSESGGNRIHYYSLELDKGQDVLIDCWGRRIDSRIDATLSLTDPGGQQLELVRDVTGRDPVLHFTAPQAGTYELGVYDFVYRNGKEYPYRLSVHDGPYIDFVFPPVGTPGSNETYTVYGRNLPGGKPVQDMQIKGAKLEQAQVKIKMPGDDQRHRLQVGSVVQPPAVQTSGMLFQLKGKSGLSNPVTIGYASAPVFVENEPANNDNPEPIEAPCEYVGQFYPARDRDYISFPAKQGDEFQLNLFSHRLGAGSDAMLVIWKVTKNDEGEEEVKEVAAVDDPQMSSMEASEMFDMRSYDPSYTLKADEDATYRVLIRDLYGDLRSDPRALYRLTIQKKQPDFQVVAFPTPQKNNNDLIPAAAVLRKGGSTAVEVRLLRRDGFQGEVNIRVEGLPQGVSCDGATLGGKVRRGWLIFTAADNAEPWAGPIQIVAKGEIDGQEVTRLARTGNLLWPTRQRQLVLSRVTRDIGLSVIDAETAPVSIKAGDGKVLETSYGGKLEIPIQVSKRGEIKGDLKVAAVGLHKDMKPGDVTVKGDSGKMEMELRSDRIPLGTYTFYLLGTAKYNYKRNQDAVKRAEEVQKRAANIVDERKKAEQEAKKASDESNQKAQTAEQELKKADDALKKADEQVKQAAEALKGAEEQLAQAQKEAKDNPDDQGKADAAKKAQEAVDAAKKKKEEADKQLTAAKKAQQTAAETHTKAQEAKQKAEEAFKAAEQMRKEAENFKKQADNNAKTEKDRNKPKDINLEVASSPIRVRIVPHPLEVTANVPKGGVKQGEMLEIPIDLERKFGFAEKVDISLELPGGVKGVSAKTLSVDKGKGEGMLELKAIEDATPGEHTAQLRIRLRFGRVNHDWRQDVTFKVDEVAKTGG